MLTAYALPPLALTAVAHRAEGGKAMAVKGGAKLFAQGSTFANSTLQILKSSFLQILTFFP